MTEGWAERPPSASKDSQLLDSVDEFLVLVSGLDEIRSRRVRLCTRARPWMVNEDRHAIKGTAV